MHSHALVAGVLLALSGLLEPLECRVRAFICRARWAPAAVEPPSDALHDQASAIPMSLNAIELALIAEHSLEMARGSQAVADDATTPPETRRNAADVAAAWRHRAELFQMEARRRSAYPIVPGVQPIRANGSAYGGPERRRRMRRTRPRRTDLAATGDGRGDRRARPERRRRERRCAEPVPR
jgi:hypothetical protein